MWMDDKLTWRWVEDRPKNKEGKYIGLIGNPPTKKVIDYITINKNSVKLRPEDHWGGTGEHQLAIGVWDDDKYTPLNRNELEFYLVTYCWDDSPLECIPPHGKFITRVK